MKKTTSCYYNGNEYICGGVEDRCSFADGYGSRGCAYSGSILQNGDITCRNKKANDMADIIVSQHDIDMAIRDMDAVVADEKEHGVVDRCHNIVFMNVSNLILRAHFQRKARICHDKIV